MTITGDEPIWRLTIETEGRDVAVWGGIGSLGAVFNDWHEHGGVAGGRLLVEGVTDTCDRAPVRFSIERERIKSMHLVRAW